MSSLSHCPVVLVLIMLLCAAPAHSRKEKRPGAKNYIYRVEMLGKPQTGFTLAHPEEFLSPKSVERRRRQALPVDSTDLPLSPLYIQRLNAVKGMSVVGGSKWNNTALVSTIIPGADTILQKLDFVKGVTHVYTAPDSIQPRPARPKYHAELQLRDTTLHTPYGEAQEQIHQLHGELLHQRGFRGRGMTIAVMDAGFLNADLIPCMRSIDVVGFLDLVVPQSKSIFTEMEHGTQVLSVMGVGQEGVFVGTAPEASYWLLRCEDEQSEQPVEEDYWARAAEVADSVGADIISCSLGFCIYDNPNDTHPYWQQDGQTALISRTASMLARKGIVLVNSAGNEGMSAWKRINFPADARDILSVGAVTPEGRNAAFSSVGPTADGRVKPEVMAQGSPATVVSERGTLTSDMGTSYAAPIVAGLVACYWQAHPQKTALEVISDVIKSSSNTLHPDNVYGYGIPDFTPRD